MAAACDTSDQSRLRNWKGGFLRGLDDDEEYDPQQRTVLDGITFVQARWRGTRARRKQDALKHSHFRAWTLEVVGVDGLTIASRTVRNPQALSTGNNGKTSSASDTTWHPCLHQYQYRVVVTVIQDMAPVGIESSAPPVQLFRFDTPALSAATTATADTVEAAGAAAAAGIPAAMNKGGARPLTPRSMIGGSATEQASVEFSSEIFVPGTKPWVTAVFTVVRQQSIPHETKEKALPTKGKRGRAAAAAAAAAKVAAAAAAAAAAAPPVLVGQAHAHLNTDLCRGTSRYFSLPLSSQYFPVDTLQMATPDHLPEGVTIRTRIWPFSDVASKCGYIHVTFSSGRLNTPTERPSRYFGVLASGVLCLYSKAYSQKPPRARLTLQGASVWAKKAALLVFASLRTPDDAGRTNFQVHASTLDEVNAWRSRLHSASAA
ncbi:unnamed protein product [Ectocarpus sp. 8 AP-2014]